MSFFLFLTFLLLVTSCGEKTDAGLKTGDKLKTGAEMLVASDFELVKGKNVGVITNHTATVGGDRHIVDLMYESPHVNLVALFGPEHGIRGEVPAGDPVDFAIDEATGLPVHSLYGEVRAPTAAMLEGIDVLIFDIQDIGARFYTYISTMGKSMEAAARHDLSFVVLDRPNPIGGEKVEGPVREPGFTSFVGYFPVPVTHGLTVGELAIMAREEGMLAGVEDLDLHVIPMNHWDRSSLWPDHGRPWNPPSPNIPDFETALIYPGACFFEGLRASEGRGTREPFIQLGTPWADGEALAGDLNARDIPGLRFEPVSFTPESIPGMAIRPKYRGTKVHGVRYVVTDKYVVRPLEAGIHVIDAFYRQAPDHEKERFFDKARFGRLAGSNRLYELFTGEADVEEIIDSWSDDVIEFEKLRRNYFLYH